MEVKDDKIRNALWRQEMARKNFLRPGFLELGLTPGQGQPRILKVLREKGPLTQKELAGLCSRDTATVSRALDRMEAAGLVERMDNPACRRSYLIHLTEKGERMAEEVEEIFCRCDRIMFRGLEAEDRENLCRILERLAANLEKGEE